MVHNHSGGIIGNRGEKEAQWNIIIFGLPPFTWNLKRKWINIYIRMEWISMAIELHVTRHTNHKLFKINISPQRSKCSDTTILLLEICAESIWSPLTTMKTPTELSKSPSLMCQKKILAFCFSFSSDNHYRIARCTLVLWVPFFLSSVLFHFSESFCASRTYAVAKRTPHRNW